ncbi:MAG: hypothetical protein J6J16_09740 [Lachnospiraceae bacterium]|nr:hypothetical protein [Lachnospiraceae bacterium]
MLIDRTTIPIWVAENAKLPQHMLRSYGADFCYCIKSAMLEDIEWQESIGIEVDKPLLIERKWYRVWFERDTYGHFADLIPDTFYEKSVLAFRMGCIYRRLSKNRDLRKEFVRILQRALEV